ncbi:3-hydroxyacyl-CoA dehydrogenase [Pseudonocardia sp. CNS-139]|nr:3-hydroxyacyl-CoA dehydrogenase [Pseudonocardia sp. CNS-139]
MSRIAVVGAGYMGGGIAQAFALAGHDVTLADSSAEVAEKAVERLVAEGEKYAADGLFPDGAGAVLAQRLHAAPDAAAAVADAWYVTEAVFERIDVKHDVLRTICEAAPADAVIGTNTSAIPIAELAEAVTGPERFLGVHWMNPSYFVPCVEVIPTTRTDAAVVERVADLLREAGKQPTVVADTPGFVANRLQFALYKECTRMVEEGAATPAQIDEVVRNSFGFRLPFFGPFLISDIAGLDVYRASMATLERDLGERLAVPQALTDQVEAGRLGLKSGEGFFPHGPEDAERLRRYRDAGYAWLAALRAQLDAEG